MSQSSLVTRQWWANESNFNYGRPNEIQGIIIHHAASTSLDSVGVVFSQYGRQASAHYGVKGKAVHQYVREEDTAWHCGVWSGNCRMIGIETVNSTGAPDWLVDEETFETLVKLCADIAKRNNLGMLKFEPNEDFPNLSAHRDWYATYCPGDYLYSRMNELANRANDINYPVAPKAELIWSELTPEAYLTDKQPTCLYDFNHTHKENCGVVKEFDKGTEIEIAGRVENKTIGEYYLVSKYSWDNKKANGFLVEDMVLKNKPDPEPEPEPEPTPDPEPGPEPEDPTVGILQKIIAFIQHIIDLITRKDK